MIRISNDYIIATEMQLMFDKITGFEPVKGDLTNWKGQVGIIQGTNIPIFLELWINRSFPDSPPKAQITPKLNHPNVDDDNTLSLRILSQWTPRNHLYEVVDETRRLFAKVPALPYRTKVRKQNEESSFVRMQAIPFETAPLRQVPFSQTMPEDSRISTEMKSIEHEITRYQDRIETINKEIEEERSSLLKNVGVSTKGKEMDVSLDAVYSAEIEASKDLLETLEEKFEDGDIESISFLRLTRKYNQDYYKAEKRLERIQNGSGTMDENILDLEADLYATIVTLENLARSYENQDIGQIAYKKQLRALVRAIFKSRMKLEKVGFELEGFIKREKLAEKCPNGIRQLRIAEGAETADAISIPFESLKKMPTKTADFVSAAIELIDLTRLKSVARADLLLTDLDEMISIAGTFPGMEKDHWMLQDMNNWRDIVSKYKTQEIIKENDAEKLEFQCSRWLNEFRRMLKAL